MGMEINATLVVQAFNFFIAYLMLRILLFKPAATALEQEKKEHDHLNARIRDREQKLEQTAEQKQKIWREFQDQFEQSSPDVHGVRGEHPAVEPAKAEDILSDKQTEQLAHEVEQAIVKRVQHDN